MTSTSLKHHKFCREPIGDKPASALPGIGPASSLRLKKHGIHKASTVMRHFIFLYKDKESFENWLDDKCRSNKRHGGACYNALKEWLDQFSF